MLLRRSKFRIETERMTLRLPQHSDYRQWVDLRERSRDFLGQWEPIWSSDHLTRRGFANRVYWAQNAHSGGTALPLFLIR
ncbi:MAG: 30S ribosomal protein S5 alanine N-acetyltransferase, partial [Paracoccaceae bacterium]|nr:30S ribosomal protein S5 alanine N-acetyltransferase [Paracoccaceae bacterium]